MNSRSRGCPDIGVWRAWLDHELDSVGDSPALAEHLADCPGCQRLLAEVREDAHAASDALTLLAPTRLPSAAEVAVARERLEWRRARRAPRLPVPIHSLEPIPMFTRFSAPWRAATGGLAAALALALLVAFTPQGSSVAAAFLAAFRSQDVTAIEVTPQTQADIVKTMNALGSLGRVQLPGAASQASPAAAARAAERQAQTNISLSDAARTVGFNLLTPDPASLPAVVNKTPNVRVMPVMQVRFTLDKKMADAYFQANGHPDVSVPSRFDGATLVVSIPAAAMLEYGSSSSGKQEVVIGEAGEVVVDAEGNVSLSELRDFLLGLPTLPKTVANQLKNINNWNNTMPIPVPVDQVHWEKTTINGSPGLLLNDNSGVGSGAIWHSKDGHLFGVAGTLKATELTSIANTLAVR
jgi:hypothetical protein